MLCLRVAYQDQGLCPFQHYPWLREAAARSTLPLSTAQDPRHVVYTVHGERH